MGGTLLLADDSITIQKVVELTFAETEHKVIAVGSGRDLFKRLPEVKPDVVLCDVVMPDMNGYEVCQTLKSDPGTLHIPVVLLTGTFEPFDRDRALAAGCDAIVTKPFEARELINTVEDLIKRAQALATAPAEAGMVNQGIPDGVPALDFTGPGFDKLAAPPPPPASPPEDGIDLTESALGKSNPPVPRPAPPELQEPVAPQAPPSFAFGSEEPPGFSEPSAVKVTPPEVFAPGKPAEPASIPSSGAKFEPEQPGITHPVIEKPAPLETAAVFTPAEAPVLPPPERAMDEGPTQSFPIQPAPTAPDQARPTPPAGAAFATGAITDDVVERIARRAVELLPRAAPAPAATPSLAGSDSLTDEQVDRIARRVVELATPQLERIAWEVIPDMAEMLVRKRIAELEGAAEEEN